eukprot:jgi/Mesen1/9514/ME000637S08958
MCLSTCFLSRALYIITQSVGAALLGAGINFGVATAIYKSTRETITVFEMPTTLAGDAGVTIILQAILTWILHGLLVRLDVEQGRQAAMGGGGGGRAPLESGLLGWWLGRGNFDFVSDGPGRLRRVLATCGRALLFSALSLCLFWPLSVAFLCPEWCRAGAVKRWPGPEIFKAVLGAALGLALTPVVTLVHPSAAGKSATFAFDIDTGSIWSFSGEQKPRPPPYAPQQARPPALVPAGTGPTVIVVTVPGA